MIVLRKIFEFGPLIFGLGFLAPLISQLIALAGWNLPLGLSPLAAGLTCGGLLGLAAQLRGRWI